jgi:branched-chain amino acid transport system permease protein
MLSLERSADALLILIIGGTGYLYGGIFGALIYRLLQDYLSDLTARYWQFWIGLLLVAIVIIGRERIGGWIAPVVRFASQLGRRQASSEAAPKVAGPGEGG